METMPKIMVSNEKKANVGCVFLVFLVFCTSGNLFAKEIVVRNSSELSNALGRAGSGTVILLEPGKYDGGIYMQGVSGEPDAPIIIRGADPEDPPVFSGGGGQAMHLVDCCYIHLADIKVIGFPVNGINIDDGGSFDSPSHHIALENLTILNTGPKGNHDALKMSGVDQFLVKKCYFEGWGGSGIDMVGCHEGRVTGCTFVGKKGYSQSNGVQLKGGTSKVIVEKNLFKNSGHRSINLGGSTGLQFFRPKVNDYEAKDIVVAGNTFIGSSAPVAWVTADGGHVHHNTFIFPEKWILRILQETRNPKFKKCNGGTFEKNLIVYDSRVKVFVNTGSNTAPETFRFRGNGWFQVDGDRKPVLPSKEKQGIYQVDISMEKSDFDKGYIYSEDRRIRDIGAKAYKPKTKSKRSQ